MSRYRGTDLPATIALPAVSRTDTVGSAVRYDLNRM
jgi:hypothetical protein